MENNSAVKTRKTKKTQEGTPKVKRTRKAKLVVAENVTPTVEQSPAELMEQVAANAATYKAAMAEIPGKRICCKCSAYELSESSEACMMGGNCDFREAAEGRALYQAAMHAAITEANAVDGEQPAPIETEVDIEAERAFFKEFAGGRKMRFDANVLTVGSGVDGDTKTFTPISDEKLTVLCKANVLRQVDGGYRWNSPLPQAEKPAAVEPVAKPAAKATAEITPERRAMLAACLAAVRADKKIGASSNSMADRMTDDELIAHLDGVTRGRSCSPASAVAYYRNAEKKAATSGEAAA